MKSDFKKKIVESVSGQFQKEGQKADVKINVQRPKEPIPPSIFLMQTFAFLSASTLSPVACKVLFYFLGQSQFENYVGIDIKTLSEDIEMSERSVIRALNELTENNIVTKVKYPRDKRRNDYFIHPVAAWKGNGINRKKALQKLASQIEDPNQLSLFGEELTQSLKREETEIKTKKPAFEIFKQIDLEDSIEEIKSEQEYGFDELPEDPEMWYLNDKE